MKIRWWYDSHEKLWLVQVLDNQNNEVEKEWCIKKDIKYHVNILKQEYNIIDARKYKKGE